LKLTVAQEELGDQESPPARGRGLKPPKYIKYTEPWTSPPARGRGLKLEGIYRLTRLRMSPPARGRGLKHR